MKNPVPFWGRLSTLWLALTPLCALLYTLTTTLSGNDFWWHAAAGRLIAEGGSVPFINHFSWAVHDLDLYVYQNWLAEWLIYKVLAWGGLTWIVIWRSAAAGLAFLLVGLAAFRRARRLVPGDDPAVEAGVARCVAISLFLSLGMIALNLDARPQTFALPFFGVLVWLLCEFPAWGLTPKRVALCALALGALTALWANFHGSFFLAPLALVIVFCGESAYAVLGGRGRSLLGAARAPGARWTLALLTLVCGLAIAINPLGFGLFGYVVKLSTNNTIQKYMYEWQAPSFAEGGSVVFYLSPVFLLLIARIAGRRPGREVPGWLGSLGIRPGELLLLLALFVMGCRNMRSILWYALLFPPLFAPSLARAFASQAEAETGGKAKAAKAAVPGLNAVLLVVLLLAVVPLLPRYKAALGWPDSFKARFAPTPRGSFPAGFNRDPELLLDKTTPVAAVDFLRGNPPVGRLWNDMGCGAYLMWALPEVKVSADPRIELYPNDYWLKYLKLSQGPADAGEQLAAQGVSDVLLDPEAQRGLVRYLRARTTWEEIRLPNSHAVLMRRK